MFSKSSNTVMAYILQVDNTDLTDCAAHFRAGSHTQSFSVCEDLAKSRNTKFITPDGSLTDSIVIHMSFPIHNRKTLLATFAINAKEHEASNSTVKFSYLGEKSEEGIKMRNTCLSKRTSSGRSLSNWSRKSAKRADPARAEKMNTQRGLRKKLTLATIERDKNRTLKLNDEFAPLADPLADPLITELNVENDNEHDMYVENGYDTYDDSEHIMYNDSNYDMYDDYF